MAVSWQTFRTLSLCCLLALANAADHAPLPTASEPQWSSHSRLSDFKLLEAHGHDPQNALTSYGQEGEDTSANNHYFRGARDGVFLELGALNGVLFSNTKLFEDNFQWRGLLIEPNPEEFQHLVRNRPDSICVNAAICSHEQTLHFVSGNLGAVGGIWEFMSPSFRAHWHGHAENMPDHAQQISCVPLRQILSQYGVDHIDFFSLDTEGAELEVLKTIDFEAVRIKVLLVELDGSNAAKDDAVRALLARHNYVIDTAVTKQHQREGGLRNEWFVHKSYVHHNGEAHVFD